MAIPDAAFQLVAQHFAESVPHNKALGLRAVELMDDGLVSELPYDRKLVGNPETGFLHGGAITTLIDATCGMAIPIAAGEITRAATLDLRIDYLKPATPELSVFCRAHCYKMTRNIAFVRATSDCGDAEEPIASAAGSFIIFRENAR